MIWRTHFQSFSIISSFCSLFSPCDDAPDYGMELPEDGQKSSSNSYQTMFSGTSRLTEPEESGIVRDRDDEFQITRHIGLLLTLCFSMFVVSRNQLFIYLNQLKN